MEDENLRQIHTAGPVGMGQKVVPVRNAGILCTGPLARLSAHTVPTRSAVGMHLVQFPCLPFCVLFYKQLIILWFNV